MKDIPLLSLLVSFTFLPLLPLVLLLLIFRKAHTRRTRSHAHAHANRINWKSSYTIFTLSGRLTDILTGKHTHTQTHLRLAENPAGPFVTQSSIVVLAGHETDSWNRLIQFWRFSLDYEQTSCDVWPLEGGRMWSCFQFLRWDELQYNFHSLKALFRVGFTGILCNSGCVLLFCN